MQSWTIVTGNEETVVLDRWFAISTDQPERDKFTVYKASVAVYPSHDVFLIELANRGNDSAAILIDISDTQVQVTEEQVKKGAAFVLYESNATPDTASFFVFPESMPELVKINRLCGLKLTEENVLSYAWIAIQAINGGRRWAQFMISDLFQLYFPPCGLSKADVEKLKIIISASYDLGDDQEEIQLSADKVISFGFLRHYRIRPPVLQDFRLLYPSLRVSSSGYIDNGLFSIQPHHGTQMRLGTYAHWSEYTTRLGATNGATIKKSDASPASSGQYIRTVARWVTRCITILTYTLLAAGCLIALVYWLSNASQPYISALVLNTNIHPVLATAVGVVGGFWSIWLVAMVAVMWLSDQFDRAYPSPVMIHFQYYRNTLRGFVDKYGVGGLLLTALWSFGLNGILSLTALVFGLSNTQLGQAVFGMETLGVLGSFYSVICQLPFAELLLTALNFTSGVNYHGLFGLPVRVQSIVGFVLSVSVIGVVSQLLSVARFRY